ncbi:hypothetical protein, partial [Reichenbachiella sp.]
MKRIVLCCAFQIFLCSISISQITVFSAGFETDADGWSTANWTRDADAALGASDGNYLHPTSFDDYGESVSITSTRAIDLTGYYGLVLQLDISFNTDVSGGLGNDDDGFTVEYSSDAGGNWDVLGDINAGINWFNNSNLQGDALGSIGWAGNSSGWITASVPLPASLENNSQAMFRVRFASGSYFIAVDPETYGVGVGFDNFTILSYSSHDGTPGNVPTNLSLWLKANSRILLDDNELAVWADESGNDNHAYEETSADRPISNGQMINDNPVINFDNSHIEGAAGIYTNEIFVVVDPDFISSSSAETGDILGYQPGDVGSLELGAATVDFADELVTHTESTSGGYRSAFQDLSGEVVLANPMIIND